MQEIIGNAMRAVEKKRWLSADPTQPNTVEFGVRIFRVRIQHGVNLPGEWTMQDKAFVQRSTRECLASTDSSVLDSIIPHLQALVDMAPDHMPALAKCICKLRSVDFTSLSEVERSESACRNWL